MNTIASSLAMSPTVKPSLPRKKVAWYDEPEFKERVRQLIIEGEEHNRLHPQTYTESQIRKMYNERMNQLMKRLAKK